MIVALLIVHLSLPAGRRSFAEIAPGMIATLLLWLGAGAVFGRYLASYAFAYVSMYAGLASAMIALVFLYLCAIDLHLRRRAERRDQAGARREELEFELYRLNPPVYSRPRLRGDRLRSGNPEFQLLNLFCAALGPRFRGDERR